MIAEGASMDAKQTEAMSAMLRGIIEALVDHPESVSIFVITQSGESVLRVQVAASDLGKVVGKQGRTARSLRTILAAVSMKLHHRLKLDIAQETIGETEL